MADATLAVGALGVAVILLVAGILSVLVLFIRAERAWRSERAELLNRIQAENPREFAQLQKAVEPRSDVPERAEEEPALIGTY